MFSKNKNLISAGAQWKDLSAKSEARLEALFSTVSAVADYDFGTFDDVRGLSPVFAIVT